MGTAVAWSRLKLGVGRLEETAVNLSDLHEYLRSSATDVLSGRFQHGFRALLESRSAELLLTDLLFCVLYEAGLTVSREYPLGGKRAADILLHGETPISIEAKQLHLKDGCKIAVGNLGKDLLRHGPEAIGVMFCLDERSSTLHRHFQRFGNANRRAKSDATAVSQALNKAFSEVFPASADDARLKSFERDGRVDLYGFVVRGPLAAAQPTVQPDGPASGRSAG